jgi:Glycoside-hydrolase family GH114
MAVLWWSIGSVGSVWSVGSVEWVGSLWSSGVLAAQGRPARPPAIRRLPTRVAFDYQLGGDYPPGPYTPIVVRDWYSGKALPKPGYSICYINAFQTQADDEQGLDRPDETANWPASVVLKKFEDPNWPGEFMVDLSTPKARGVAFQQVKQMIDRCAENGFGAAEFDNLDSFTRNSSLPFGQGHAVLYATALAKQAHHRGLAVAQKNTPQLTKRQSLTQIGFDFAIAEGCGEFNECDRYTSVFGDALLAVEYSDAGFATACRISNGTFAVVLRDRELAAADTAGHRIKRCENGPKRPKRSSSVPAPSSIGTSILGCLGCRDLANHRASLRLGRVPHRALR